MFVYKDKISNSSNSCKWKWNQGGGIENGVKWRIFMRRVYEIKTFYEIDTLASSWGKESK